MKKFFLSIVMLIFVACTSVHYSNEVAAIKKTDKTVFVIAFPYDYEIPLENSLKENGWTVYVVDNKDKLGNKKANFAIEYPYNTDTGGLLGLVGVTTNGAIGISDLRTGKRFAIYDFKLSTKNKIVADITNIMQSIPGAK